MAQLSTKDLTTLPVGRLGLIPLESCQSLGLIGKDIRIQKIFLGGK